MRHGIVGAFPPFLPPVLIFHCPLTGEAGTKSTTLCAPSPGPSPASFLCLSNGAMA